MKEAGRSVLQGNPPTVLLAIPLFLLLFLLNPPTDRRAALQAPASDCIKQEFNDYEVVASKLLDMDGDGGLEEVALVANDDLYVVMSQSLSSTNCQIVLEEQVTSLLLRDGKQTVELSTIEQVELTGDDLPELYIWLEEEGAGPRIDAAIHLIFSLVNSGWQEVLRLDQCRFFNSVEFREIPGESARAIYRDTDLQCEPPFSQERIYDVFHWNGTQFVSTQSGTIGKWSLSPPIWYALCGVPIIVMISLVTLPFIRFVVPRTRPEEA